MKTAGQSQKEIIKIVAAFVVIILVFLVSDLLFGIVADKAMVSKSRSKTNYDLKLYENKEIIVLGSSRATHHYDMPYLQDKLGKKVYNFGLDGRGITYHEAILASYLTHSTPDVIVLEVLPNDFDGRLNERVSVSYPYIRNNTSIRSVAEGVDINNRFLLKSGLFRYNGALLNEIKYMLKPYDPDLLGYVPLSPRKMEGMKEDTLPINDNFDSVSLESFKHIAEMSEKSGARLVVVISPLYLHISNLDPLRRVFLEADVDFIDNSSLRLSSDPHEVFNDNLHLNERGARLYTEYFIRQLDSIGILKYNK